MKTEQITISQYKIISLILIGLLFLCVFVLSLITDESVAKGVVINREQSPTLFIFSIGIDILAAIACFAIAVYWLL